jgi:hypothetical protein
LIAWLGAFAGIGLLAALVGAFPGIHLLVIGSFGASAVLLAALISNNGYRPAGYPQRWD